MHNMQQLRSSTASTAMHTAAEVSSLSMLCCAYTLGSERVQQNSSCVLCTAAAGALRCVSCPEGTYKASAGNEGISACVACPAGTEPSGSKKQCGE